MKPMNESHRAVIPWPVEVDPEHLREATSRLVTYVSSQVDDEGAIRGECRSRVLESALALSLMTRTGVALPARDRVLAYLREHLDSPRSSTGSSPRWQSDGPPTGHPPATPTSSTS